MLTLSIDEVVDAYDDFFPCTFIHRYSTNRGEPHIIAFDEEKAREFVNQYGYMGGECNPIGRAMADALPARCLFEELLRAANNRGWDFLDDDGRIRLTDG